MRSELSELESLLAEAVADPEAKTGTSLRGPDSRSTTTERRIPNEEMGERMPLFPPKSWPRRYR
jgi:hypothetical protein